MSEKRGRERERDVLCPMSLTLDVFHFERSPLNAQALPNAIQKKQKDKKVIQKKKESIQKRTILLITRFIINKRYR